MKTNFSLNRKVKKLFVALLMCFAAFLLPQQVFAQSGASCSSAINLATDDTCFSGASSGSTFWYEFTADTSALHVSLINLNGNDSIITRIILYGGDCSSLVAMDTSLFDPSTYLILKASGLTVGNIYFLQLFQPSGNPSHYNICLKSGYTDITSCSGCPSFLYNSSSYCELVCNGDFEYYTAPPTDFAQITNACPWYRSNGSSDYFNTNHTYTPPGGLDAGVPANSAGVQTSLQGGQEYAGFITYTDPSFPYYNLVSPNYREYVIQQLISPMIAGKTYTVSFNVSLSDYSGFASKDIGIWITSFSPSQNASSSLNITPNFSDPNFITDVNNWTNISFSYTANAGDQYITIGQFTNDPGSFMGVTPTSFPPNNSLHYFAYYYLDKVSVLPANVTLVTAAPTDVCPGSSTNLSAIIPVGSTGNIYSWTPSSQVNPTNTQNTTGFPSGTGTWFVCNTYAGYGACYEADSVFVNVLPPAPAVNAGSDITICKGQSATLNATGTGNTYGWSVLNGPVLCSLCTTTVVSPTVTTSYVYHATNSHGGCTNYDTMTVFVNPLPNIHIVVPAGAVTCDGSHTFSATGVPSGATYLWHSNLPSVGTASTFSVTWPNTFGIDGYVLLDVTDISGCTGHDSIVIPFCCCKGSASLQAVNDNVDSLILHYPSTVIVSGSNTTITTQSLCINGIFTVNRNLDLKNINISMGTNAKINILPGFTFTLEGVGNAITQQTIVHACDRMWDGIYINPTALLKINDGTVIEDGIQAIVSINGGDFQIQGGGGSGPVKLNKNLVAIWIKPFSGTHTGYIRHAIISCDDPFQPGGTTYLSTTSPGPNLIAPYSTSTGIMGVRIDSCNSITIGDSTQNSFQNVFERTRYGVFATRSNVNVWNNDFRYIQSTYIITHANPFPDGVAVYATNKIFVPIHTLTVGRPGLKKATNRFQWCSYGVMAENQMNLNCEYNKFDSCTVVGIYSQNNGNRNILINADTLHDCIGINIKCLKSNNATINITNNQMNQSLNVLPGNYGQTGIYVANSISINTHLLIQNNSIKKMRNGIWVSRVNNAKIVDNGPITFISSQNYSVLSPATGIHVDASMNVKVRNNKVKFTGTLTAPMYDQIFGIYIENCRNDTVTQDSLISVGSGIFLKGSDNPSILACNKMKNCIYGINFGLAVTQTPVVINDQLLYSNSQTITPTGNVWTGNALDLKGQILPPGIYWYYNGPIPSNGLAFGSLITNAPFFTPNSDQCSNFLLPPSTSDVTRRDYMLHDICVSPRSYDTLADDFTYADYIFAYRMLRENPKWLNLGTGDDVSYQNFYTFYSAHNIGKLADVEDAIDAGNITTANSILNLVTPESKYNAESNRKTVMGVYLQSWSLDSITLSDDEIGLLLPVANQGSTIGGNSVFDARNMLGIEVHDSSNMRMSHLFENNNQEITAGHIYPNPATGQISIKTNLPDDQDGILNIYDLMGRKLVSWKLSGGQEVYSFDASFLSSGTYIYQLTTLGKIIATDRLIMIKE